MIVLWVLLILMSVAAIVWGAETFAEHLGTAAVRLRVSLFALSLLLAGAEQTDELEEAQTELASLDAPPRVGKALLLVLAGVAAMAIGATVLVEAVRQISHVEETQTKLGLTLVGFTTAFELVVLAWSTARREASEAVVAGVVGSFAYNVTMTLGVAAIVRPLQVLDATHLHVPLLLMLAALILVILLAAPTAELNKIAGGVLVLAYPLALIVMLLS